MISVVDCALQFVFAFHFLCEKSNQDKAVKISVACVSDLHIFLLTQLQSLEYSMLSFMII